MCFQLKFEIKRSNAPNPFITHLSYQPITLLVRSSKEKEGYELQKGLILANCTHKFAYTKIDKLQL